MNKYYVYAHKKPDGEVFYVGKGTGRRLFFTGNRSAFWKRIVAKYDYTAFLLEEGLPENLAYEREIFWIKHYKDQGQCVANFTLGGDGIRVEKRWWNDKIGASLRGKKRQSGKGSKSFKDYVTENDLRKMYIDDGMPSTEIADITGLSYTTVCARLRQYGIPRRAKGRIRRTITCITDGASFTSISDAAKFYSLKRELINKVLAGKYKTTGGKSFIYSEEHHEQK